MAVYHVGSWIFEVYPINQAARTILTERTDMSEKEYVEFLHLLRGREAPDELLWQLNDWPWEADDPLPPLPWGIDPDRV